MRGHRLGRHSGGSSDYWPRLLVFMFPSQSVELFSSLSFRNAFWPVSWLHPSCWVFKTSWRHSAEIKLKRACCYQPAGHHHAGTVGVKPWCVFRGELLLPCLQRICKNLLCRKQSVVFANEKSSFLLFSYIISDLLCVQSKTNPENKKSTGKSCFGPQKSFAVADCQVHSQDTTHTCGQPSSLPQQLPRHFWACWGTQGTWVSPHRAGLCGSAREGTGSSMAGWHPCPFAGHGGGTSPGVLAKGRELGVMGSSRKRKGWALEAAQAAAPERRQQRC